MATGTAVVVSPSCLAHPARAMVRVAASKQHADGVLMGFFSAAALSHWFQRILVIRWMSGSVKRSFSSVLRVENSETTAPSPPAWNQCRVLGEMVYWSPGFRAISCQTV